MKKLLIKISVIIVFFITSAQTNDDIKKLESDIKKAATDIAETLKIEVAIKGKKLTNFFTNNDLKLISENGLREYKFKNKTYEIIKDNEIIQSGSWKINGLLKNQIRLISNSDKKKYYLKKISKKPWIYNYDKRPGSEGAKKEILHIRSSSKFNDVVSKVTFSFEEENSEKLPKKNEDQNREKLVKIQKTNEDQKKEKVAKVQKTNEDQKKEKVVKKKDNQAEERNKILISCLKDNRETSIKLKNKECEAYADGKQVDIGDDSAKPNEFSEMSKNSEFNLQKEYWAILDKEYADKEGFNILKKLIVEMRKCAYSAVQLTRNPGDAADIYRWIDRAENAIYSNDISKMRQAHGVLRGRAHNIFTNIISTYGPDNPTAQFCKSLDTNYKFRHSVPNWDTWLSIKMDDLHEKKYGKKYYWLGKEVSKEEHDRLSKGSKK